MFLKMLRKERDNRGWTQEEVAKKIEVSRSAYANYESGKREPDFDTSQKLATLFETTIDKLLGSKKIMSSVTETEEEKLRAIVAEKIQKIKNIDDLNKAIDHLEYLENKNNGK